MAGNSTVLLTGATGLVGRFLLAGLMRRQVPTIVLARAQSHRSAAARIDEALAPFETHNLLPRPIVVDGDLTEPGLGLDQTSLEHLQSVPLRILHSAASIRFTADSPTDEPYATNVEGTKNLLRLASQWTVQQFHQVSTAYVQCDRNPTHTVAERTAFEVPVTSLDKAGNDYERSKVQSEQLVSQCPHIGTKTIYRPSIVVGDSRTGYTSTYHGFYAPLQIAMGIVKSMRLDAATADEFRRRLGLHSHDSKNLVPVDWLAEAILHLMHTPEAIGGIYHLTHPQPASLSDMQSAIIDALTENVQPSGERTSSLQIHPELFRQQMAVYESYFQDDPPFDHTQADRFLKSLPCPLMNYGALKGLAQAAVNNNFGWPKPPPPQKPQWRLAISTSSNGDNGHRNMGDGGAGNGNLARTAPNLRDVEFELQVLGGVKRLAMAARNLRFCRRQSSWIANSVLSSITTGSPWKLVVTEQSLLTALSSPIAPEQMLADGRWIASGSLPKDWMDIVKDCLAHMSIVDVETTT